MLDAWIIDNVKKNIKTSTKLFERGASEAAAGRFPSVAAKLVKTATQIPIYIRVKKKYPNKLGRIAPLNLWYGD